MCDKTDCIINKHNKKYHKIHKTINWNFVLAIVL